MPKPTAPKYTWHALEIDSKSGREWDDLGISPSDFRILREAAPDIFPVGDSDERETVWKLLKSGGSITRILKLARRDLRESTSVLAYLAHCADREDASFDGWLQDREEWLFVFESENLASEPKALACWVTLRVSVADVRSYQQLGLVGELDDADLEFVYQAMKILQSDVDISASGNLRTAALRLGAENLRALYEDDSYQFMLVLRSAVDAEDERWRKERFAAGESGDWKSLGLDLEEAEFLVEMLFEDSDSHDLESLFDRVKEILQDGLAARELFEMVTRGRVDLDCVNTVREAGLPMTKQSLEKWGTLRDPRLVLLCVDFDLDPEILRRASDNLTADQVLAWWDFCRSRDWFPTASNRNLLLESQHEDSRTTPQNLADASQLLELSEYNEWASEPMISGKIEEICKWRGVGFQVPSRHQWTPSTGDPFQWIRAKFTPRSAAEWREVVSSVTEAQQWRAAKASPKTVRDWKQAGFSGKEAIEWHRDGISPEVARSRKALGIQPRAARSK